MTATHSIKEKIKEQAMHLGFDACGFTKAHMPQERQKSLANWVDEGRHGDMAWMENRLYERSSPEHLWPDAKSVLCLAHNYGPNNTISPLSLISDDGNAITSIYAARKDYHDVIKKRLKQLARWLVEHYGCEVKVFVDTAPVMEKPLAQLSGIGWQGKHTNLVNRDFGSWTFLGSIFMTLEIEADKAEIDHCGSCSKCLDICPTNAFPQAYQLDARKCLAYLSIEHKGVIPLAYRKPMANRVFGCDDCLAVCPWNKFASIASDIKLQMREHLYQSPLNALLSLTDQAFRERYAGTPIKRTGRDCFIRNVAIAAGNANKENDIILALETLLQDPSDIVRGAVIWALSQHQPHEKMQFYFNRYGINEQTPHVIDEWHTALDLTK